MKNKKLNFIDICPLAFQTILPYWLTFVKDGWFDWVKKGDGVIVQCANPKGIVAKIYKRKIKNNIKVEVEIISNKGDCQWGWQTGDKFALPQNLEKCSILETKKS